MSERKAYEKAICADGFAMSVQASEMNYCTPRNNEGPYYSVEIGYPTAYEPDLIQYAEDPKSPTMSVYGYVPSWLVLKVLEKHGGWVAGEIPPMVIG